MIFSISSIVQKLTPEPEKNILVILKEVKNTLGGLFCVYNKLDSSDSLLVGITSEMSSKDSPIVDDATGHICYEATMDSVNKHVVISDLTKTRYLETDPVVAELNLKSYLGVPVRLSNKSIGSLAIVDTVIREFSNDEIEIITTLALLLVLEEEHIITSKGLKVSEYKYHAVFENANDCIVLLKNNTVTDINSKGCQLFGYGYSEIIGKTTAELSPSSSEVASNVGYNDIGYISKAIKGEPQNFEWLHKKKDDSFFYAEISLTRLDGNDSYNILAIVRDISKRKEYELELIEAKKEAVKANKLKSLSLASMSHELRTPLNAIIGFSNLLLDEDTSEDEKSQFIMLIQSAGKSLMQLIGDIVDISKIEAGEVTIQKSTFNVNAFLQEVLLTFKREKDNRDKSNIELKLILSDQITDLNIETDSHRLNQIFSNLLTNSLKFIEDGYIEFGYSSISPGSIQFFVKDTGVGIGADKKEVIFDRYGQDKSTYSKNKDGTGLGLAISKSFVELLGGNIWVDSELNEGSTFYFTIPIGSSSASETNKYLRQILPGAKAIDWSAYTILIVDDVKQNYVYINGLLRHSGINVIWVQNGVEAVDFCSKNSNVDLILMDIRMPLMDGLEASEIIKRENPKIHIIAQTAFSSSAYKKQCLNDLCEGYLTKPINYKSLLTMLSKFFD